MTRGAGLSGCLLVGLCLLLASCGSTRVYPASPGPYDRLPEGWRADLLRARSALDSERYALARELLLPLAQERPQVLPVRVLLQEAELSALTRSMSSVDGGGSESEGESPDRPSAPAPDPPSMPQGPSSRPDDPGELARHRLAQVYRERAFERGSAEDWVLAARLARSGEEALDFLGRAAERDPDCVWAHYGRAWWMTRLRRFPEARESLEAAFTIDPGHAPTMRLHASMKARAGESEEAIACLEAWLDRTAADPLVNPARRAEAQVDLAALLAYALDSEGALEILSGVRREHLEDPSRAELVEAVALADLGRNALALAACRRARGHAEDDRLPLVYEAMLHGAEGEPWLELQSWGQLLERLDAAPSAGAPEEDLAWMLVRVQALTRCELLRSAGIVSPAEAEGGDRPSPSPRVPAEAAP